MTRYVALLRGINVGGQKLIKMKELVRIFTAAGFKNARTYIASGNVIFDSRATDSRSMERRIERALKKALGHEITVILRKVSDLEKLVKFDPFKGEEAGPDLMLFVVFLRDAPARKPRLPLVSKTENMEVIEIKYGTAFIESHRKRTGWFGFPNNFVEKELKTAATTRNWSTVKKIVLFAAKD
jgi:uncharacterized protein (DUF1697 family)